MLNVGLGGITRCSFSVLCVEIFTLTQRLATSHSSRSKYDPVEVCDVSDHESIAICSHHRRCTIIHADESAFLDIFWKYLVADHSPRIWPLLLEHHRMGWSIVLRVSITVQTTECALCGCWPL